MATQFLSMKEACARLGKTEDEVKALVRDGKLREFRDRGQLFFKADDVDRIGGGGTGAPLTPAKPGDSVAGGSKAGGSALGGSTFGDLALSDSPIGASHAGSPAVPKAKSADSAAGGLDLGGSSVGLSPSGSGELKLEALSDEKGKPEKPDVGLSGSDMLTLDEMEDLGKSGSRAGSKEDTVISSVGISVFDDDEIQIDVDPLAKTQVSPSVEDQISLEGVGSGSGLLDLTRESDDTSLGAELLDEIYPGEEESTVQEDMPTEVVPGMGLPAGAAPGPAYATAAVAAQPWMMAAAPVAPDPTANGFIGVMIVGVLMLGLTGTVLAAAVQGIAPAFLSMLYSQWIIMTAGAVGLSGVILAVGWLLGKQSQGKKPQPAAKAAAPTPAEGKKD